MYATIYAEPIDAKSTSPADFPELSTIPDEVIRDEWKQRYAVIRAKFPRNYLTAKIKPCSKCGQQLGTRMMRAHKCPAKAQKS
jgi:hypothetical protein